MLLIIGIEAMQKYSLWFLTIVLMSVGLMQNPMLLIFPMWILVYLERKSLRKLVRGIPFSVCFIGSGLFFGLLTESFAIANNHSLPPEKRILLSPDPVLDLFYGVFYYSLLIAAWYGLIKAFTYSKTEVFVMTGIFGMLTEEVGQVFVRIFTVPITGALYAISVSFVYGIFPTLAYMVSEEKLPDKRTNVVVRFLAAAIALFVQWAVYGLFVLPALKRLLS